MSLDEIVQLTITVESQVPTRLGFGTPLIMAVHDVTPNTVEIVKSPKEVTDMGFPSYHPVSRACNRMFSQNPRPSQIVIGKRNNKYTQIVHLIPVITTQGYKYAFTVADNVGVETEIEYVVPAAATVASISTAIAALVDPLTEIVSTAAATHVILTGVAGKLFNIRNLPPIAAMKVKDVTADPGTVADLNAVEAVDPTTWYAVTFDHTSEANAAAIAGWVEARRKLCLLNTTDSECVDNAVTTDIMSDLKAANYARTGTLFLANELLSYSAHAWIGGMLPTDPGRGTWCYRTLAGITTDVLTGGQESTIKLKRGNFYTNTGGAAVTQTGITASGEFIDITHFVDWLYARMQERIFGAMLQASARGSKIPYTDTGGDIIRSLVMAQLQDGIRVGGLAANPAPVVQVPKVADVDPAERIARRLPGVTFTANLAGAIHAVQITGSIAV